MAIHITREDVIRIIGNPVTQNISPIYVGQICLDTLGKECYIAYGLSPSSWKPLQSDLEINFDDFTSDKLGYINKDYSNIRTIKDALDLLLHKDIVIESFTCKNKDTNKIQLEYEVGKTGSSVALRFEWSYSKDRFEVQDFNGIKLDDEVREYEYTLYNDKTSIKEFFLTVTDDFKSYTKMVSISVSPRKYWGAKPKPENSEYTSDFITSLSSSDLTYSKKLSITANAENEQHIYYAIPESKVGKNAVAIFTVNGFTGGFKLVEKVEVTNENGFTDIYHLYESDNPGLGFTKMDITMEVV